MDTTMSDPVVGRLIDGRYSVEERLAVGGMATVYVAHDNRLDRLVALKVMHPGYAHDRDYVARFHREATAAARLNSPHVVSILDQGADNGPGGRVIYLVMELVRGRTLRALLAERGRLPVGLAVEIIEPVVAALAAAHLAGIIHRDIKPENILLGDDGRVKVADFGLARPMRTGNLSVPSLTHGLLMGTVGYLAPEQVAHGTADTRSDVYAAGIVLFEMLTGQPPHPGETPMAVAYQHVHGDVPPPSSVRPDVGPAMDAFVLSATARDPDRRPADGSAMLADLHRLLPQLPYDSGPGLNGTALVAVPTGMPAGPLNQTSVIEHPEYARTPAGWPPPIGPGRSARRAAAQPFGSPGGGPRRYGLAGLILAGVILLLIALVSFVNSGGGQGVPSVVGLNQAAATKALTQAHLKVVFDPAAPSSTEPAGTIASQNPPAGVKVHSHGTIHLVLSTGPNLIAVPSVRGLSERDATTKLLTAKLGVAGEREQVDNAIAQGQVVGTDPAAGAKVAPGVKVTLLLSAGSDQITVPNDLIGKDADAAATELQNLKLQVNRQDVESNDVGGGQVARTSPDPGQRVNPGGTVTLFVARDFGDVLGDNPTGMQVRIPTDLHGQTGRAAQAELQALGLQVRIVGRKDSHVFAVSPGQGSQVSQNSTVTLYTAF